MGSSLISVIMAVYNGERYLEEAVDSVFSQTAPSVELVVVDDGSTDDTPRILDRYRGRITSVRQTHAGIGAARNRGIALSRGQRIAILDCDDIYPHDRLAVLAAGFDATPAPDIVAGHVKQFLSPELADELKNRIRCPDEPMPGQISTCMLIERAVFDRVGPFAEQWRVGVDMEWYLRAVDAGVRIRTLPEVILLRRLHDRNNGQVNRSAFGERVLILKEAIDRRRVNAAATTN